MAREPRARGGDVRVRVRQRRFPDGRAVWTADLHVQPAGEPDAERFRITAPPTVTTRSGAERWAMERAKRIAVEGRPRNTKKARVAKAQLEAAEVLGTTVSAVKLRAHRAYKALGDALSVHPKEDGDE